MKLKDENDIETRLLKPSKMEKPQWNGGVGFPDPN